ncbi:MAG: hypothetical protein U9R08_03005 [Nanoarchaeota archaeon]|nr:hypothetical protein [Nanoarchaeota archaeon]
MHDIVKFVIPAGDIVEGEIIGITNFFVLSDNHFIIKPTILGNQIQHVHTKSIVEKMNFRKEKEVPIDPNSTSDPKPELKSEDVDSLPNKNN